MSAQVLPLLQPCACGATPGFLHYQRGACLLVRLECACGERGADLLYAEPEDRERMMRSAAVGWNYARSHPIAEPA